MSARLFIIVQGLGEIKNLFLRENKGTNFVRKVTGWLGVGGNIKKVLGFGLVCLFFFFFFFANFLNGH